MTWDYPASPPRTWALALAAVHDDAFQTRIRLCYSLPHLRAAVRHEVAGKCRADRIGQLNGRIERRKLVERLRDDAE